MSTAIIVRFDGEEYRVPGPAATEAQAYYTNDRNDAVDTAICEHGHDVKLRIRLVEILDPAEDV